MQILERQRQWQRDSDKEDQEWRAQQEKKDRVWREQQAERERQWRTEDLKRERYKGWTLAVWTLFAAVVGWVVSLLVNYFK